LNNGDRKGEHDETAARAVRRRHGPAGRTRTLSAQPVAVGGGHTNLVKKTHWHIRNADGTYAAADEDV